MIIYKQNNPLWKDINLGTSKLTIGDYGCLVTAIGMTIEETPNIVNKNLKAVGGFLGALVIWNKIGVAFPQLRFTWRGYRYDNTAALSQIKRNGFCLVEATNRLNGGKHWVLFIGNQRLYDPATGTERSTRVYNSIFWRYSGFSALDRV
jgi:hypothetical protein